MRRSICWNAMLLLALLVVFSGAARGEELQNYFVVKAGVFTPTGDLKDNDFNSGFSGEISYGYYYNPNLVFEFGLGYCKVEGSASGADPVLGDWSGDEEIMIIPLTLTAKGILPLGAMELYGGAGIGAYYTRDKTEMTVGGVSDSIEDSDTIFGGHVVVGANFNITENLFIGVEGKHVWTDKADYSGEFQGIPVDKTESDLNGYSITGNIGFKF